MNLSNQLNGFLAVSNVWQNYVEFLFFTSIVCGSPVLHDPQDQGCPGLSWTLLLQQDRLDRQIFSATWT